MREVWSLYSDKVMEHFMNPRNVGEIENPDGIGHVGNLVCGDIMVLYIKVDDSIIVDAKLRPSAAELPLPPAPWSPRW